MEELENQLKNISGKFSKKSVTTQGIRMKDLQGNIRRVPKEQVQEALKAGYKKV